MNSRAYAVTTSCVAPPPPTSYLTARGMMNREFVPTYSNMTVVSEHALLQLPNPDPTLLTAPAAAAGSLFAAATASPFRGRQYLAPNPFYRQERIFLERQILIAQMHQQHQLRLELQRLNEMSSHIGEQFVSSGSRNVQSAMAQDTRDNNMLNSMHFNDRRARK